MRKERNVKAMMEIITFYEFSVTTLCIQYLKNLLYYYF